MSEQGQISSSAVQAVQAAPVLVVDDNQGVAGALAGLINGAGYATAVFYTGRAALDYAANNPLSAAIIDIHLPDISGLALSKGLREHMGRDRPIIIVSGDTSMENLNSLPLVGATYFFSKPLKASELMARLAELLA